MTKPIALLPRGRRGAIPAHGWNPAAPTEIRFQNPDGSWADYVNVAGLNPVGAWADATAYEARDVVTNGGSAYYALSDHTSADATEPGVGGSWATVWGLLVEKGATGAAGPAGGIDFLTVSAAELATIPDDGSIEIIRTLSHTTDGDGGGARYTRAVSEPSHPGKLQSADGQWWEIAEAVVTLPMMGVFTTDTNIATELTAAFAYPYPLHVPPGTFTFGTTGTLVPAGKVLAFIGGMISFDTGITGTNLGRIRAGDDQIFIGNGAVSFDGSEMSAFNLMWWGVKGDGNSIVAAFNKATAALRGLDDTRALMIYCGSNGTGNPLVDGNGLDFTAFSGEFPKLLDWRGSSLDGQATGKNCIDLTGSKRVCIFNGALVGHSTNRPNIGVYLARETGGAVANANSLDDFDISGEFTKYSVFNYASELMDIRIGWVRNEYVSGDASAKAVKISSNNSEGITSDYATVDTDTEYSCNNHTFDQTSLRSWNKHSLHLEGNVKGFTASDNSPINTVGVTGAQPVLITMKSGEECASLDFWHMESGSDGGDMRSMLRFEGDGAIADDITIREFSTDSENALIEFRTENMGIRNLTVTAGQRGSGGAPHWTQPFLTTAGSGLTNIRIYNLLWKALETNDSDGDLDFSNVFCTGLVSVGDQVNVINSKNGGIFVNDATAGLAPISMPSLILVQEHFSGAAISDQWAIRKGADSTDFAMRTTTGGGQIRGTFGNNATSTYANNGLRIDRGIRCFQPSVGVARMEARVAISAITNIALAVGFTDENSNIIPFTIGASDAVTIDAGVDDGAAIVFDTAADTDELAAVCAKADVDQLEMLGVAPVAGTMIRLGVIIDASGNAQFLVNGVVLSALTDAVTPGVRYTPYVAGFRRDASAGTLDIDYIFASNVFPI